MRFYLKFIAILALAFTAQRYVLADHELWFAVRCQYAMVTHNQPMLDQLEQEAVAVAVASDPANLATASL